MALQDKLQEVSEALAQKMDALLPKADNLREDRLFEAMRYSSLSGGKRLRPLLTVTASELFGVGFQSSIQAAAAMEFIHCYSLIHDDLPAIDNDDFRRGQPSCHKKFDEATALLAGDALLTYAFEVLADETTHRDSSVRAELVCYVARAAGFSGMVGGQIIDILAQTQDLEYSEIVRLQRMKTGSLFLVSCEAGAILGKAPRNLRSSLKAYASNLGVAFQITDDLLDAEGTREQTGKGVKKDQELGKATLVQFLGVEQARQHAEMLAKQAVEHLAVFGSRADLLRELAEYIVNRES